jgi:hypothetical protein
MISTQISKSSSNFEADFVTIDKSDLYPDAVSSHFLLCWLTALVDCFYVMVCNKWNEIINRNNGCFISHFFVLLLFWDFYEVFIEKIFS